jgi:NDP-sugar pyrophosphorylase family protein
VGLAAEGFVVLGAEAALLGDCRLVNSVVMDGGRIGKGAEVINSIVGPKAYVPPGAKVSDAIVV